MFFDFLTKYVVTMETVDQTRSFDIFVLSLSLFPWEHQFYASKKNNLSSFLPFFPQKLRNFHSLSCPGITGEDSCESSQTLHALTSQCDTDDSSVNELGLEDAQPQTKEGKITGNAPSDPTIEEVDWNSTDYGDVTPGTTNGKDNEPLWAGLCSMRKDVYQLGGELDIEQIERNWAGLPSSWGKLI